MLRQSPRQLLWAAPTCTRRNAIPSLNNSDDHYKAWGKALMGENMKRIGPEQMFKTAIAAHEQISNLATRWVDDAKIYMCGSVVTHGQMEYGSDLDLACLLDDPFPDHAAQGQRTRKLWYAMKRYVPVTARAQLMEIVDARTPVVKSRYVNEEKVAGMRAKVLSEDEDRISRTAVIDIKNKHLTAEDLEHIASRLGRDRVEGAWTIAAPGGGCKLALQMATRMDCVDAYGYLPDGVILTNANRSDMVRETLDERFQPEMNIYKYDISFCGYGVKNSYLIRYYLHDGPACARHGAMALKAWGKATNVGVGTSAMLTSYAVTILWLYYLLVTGRCQWIEPWALPHPCLLPRYPDFSPISECDPVELAKAVHGFYVFYGHYFDYEKECVSINRPRRSTRDDVKWNFPNHKKGTFSYIFCIEDPYEEIGYGGLNLGRHLHPAKFQLVKKEFQSAAAAMEKYTPQNLADTSLLGVRREGWTGRADIEEKKAKEKEQLISQGRMWNESKKKGIFH